jgi:hypothetical protein
MTAALVHSCKCEKCRWGEAHLDQAFHRHINVLASRLDERQRRWFIALEAMRIGHGGQQLLAQITGMNRHTIERGRRELDEGLNNCATDRLRAPGGGRPAAEEHDPGVVDALEALVAPETAGDPMGRRAKGKRSSLATLSKALGAVGHPASRPTVSRLLRKLKYSPKVNARRTEAKSSPADRNTQFRHIATQRTRFEVAGDPVISVDTKKRN